MSAHELKPDATAIEAVYKDNLGLMSRELIAELGRKMYAADTGLAALVEHDARVTASQLAGIQEINRLGHQITALVAENERLLGMNDRLSSAADEAVRRLRESGPYLEAETATEAMRLERDALTAQVAALREALDWIAMARLDYRQAQGYAGFARSLQEKARAALAATAPQP